MTQFQRRPEGVDGTKDSEFRRHPNGDSPPGYSTRAVEGEPSRALVVHHAGDVS